MKSVVLQHLKDNKSLYIEEWRKSLEQHEFTKQGSTFSSKDMQQEMKDEFISVVFQSIELSIEENRDAMHRFANRLIYNGWAFSEFIRSLQALRRVVLHDVSANFTKEEFVDVSVVFEDWLDEQITRLAEEFSKIQDEVMTMQKTAMKELSAPLIPVFNKISVMPIVGTIDTKRAAQIMENLLEGIIEHRAQVVLIDITGVPVVDTMVAHHIIKASEAVRLVGAECLLVGIRPEIAQTIVNLGIDLDAFTTKSTLKKGIEAALELTNRTIETNEQMQSNGGLKR
ncbi:STAS domain-containing protein [Geomicrobium sp. JSM 1781026]|uniref:STAS domain-containing protein n=1 Tax=Geomicrobium sp. JSM 1781026 TaxID=3344580 RepID=UPI0035C26692